MIIIQRDLLSNPRDYYPGINAIMLLLEKGDDESLEKVRELTPVVIFALSRLGGINSKDYWILSTMLELSCIKNDWTMANRILPKLPISGKEYWMLATTINNLESLKKSLTTIPGYYNTNFDEIIRALASMYKNF